MEEVIYDAENAIVGRLGSFVAKDLLKGKKVLIINAEKAIVTGDKKGVVERLSILRKKGGSSQKGPIVSKMPDRLLKRMIRGMLPWDRTKGREAYKRLICYTSNSLPSELKTKSAKKIKMNLPLKFITIKEISERI